MLLRAVQEVPKRVDKKHVLLFGSPSRATVPVLAEARLLVSSRVARASLQHLAQQ